MKPSWRAPALAACVACLAACASLPSLDDVAARRAQQASAQHSSRSSYDRSARIVAQAEGREGSGDFLARHLEIEQAISGAPLTAGNQVRLLPDGPATYRAMRQAIAQARRFIHMETYIFEDGETGELFADALIRKREEGVEVALMVDAAGTLDTSQDLFERMRRAGIPVIAFNPVNPLHARGGWSPNERNHRKILVVDGKVGYLGGINVSDVYSSSAGSGSAGGGTGSAAAPRQAGGKDAMPWRDTHIEVRGPAVAGMESIFVQGWREQKGPPLAQREYLAAPAGQGPLYVRILANDPGQDDSYAIYLTLMSAIRAAAKSIHVTMAYFVPDPAFLQALQDAARRGVEVVLVLPGFSDSSLVFRAGRSYYTPLFEAGVAIYERRNALLHAKTVVIDGVWSTVGSSNMDWRSFALNHEVNAVILGPAFGAEMESLFQRDVEDSVRIDPETWSGRPLADRFMEVFSRLFERWL